MEIEKLGAIDVNCHIGQYGSRGSSEMACKILSASPKEVLRQAAKANIEISIICPYEVEMQNDLPNTVIEENEKTAKIVSEEPGFLQWIFLTPNKKILEHARELIKLPKSFGFKINSELGYYDIKEEGDMLFSFAAEYHAIISVNSGAKGTKPEIYSEFANRYPEIVMILNCLGRRWESSTPDFQTLAIQGARHNNVHTDTSSVRSIKGGIIEWAIKEVGASYIVFGSDSPSYFASSQRVRIDKADISDRAKRMILRKNTEFLIDLEREYNNAQA